MSRKTGLGRGFESLIPTDVLDETFDSTASNDEQISELRHLRIDVVSPDPEQPRRHFDEESLADLAESIAEHGIIQPLIVIAVTGGYQIVAGERRWRAAKLAGLEKVPAIVRTLTNQHKLELALIENLQRRDLNPLETATAYLKLHTQFNMTYEDIGHRVGGKAISTISNVMRLLQLPPEAKTALIEGTISEGHARQILALDDPAVAQELLDYIIDEGWSVRKAEQYVVGYKKGTRTLSRERAVKHTRTETPLTQAIGKRLALPVTLKTMAKGGQIIITFKDDAELERVKQLLG
ncbi:ParB/RepB/Spo0J family partition protein [Pedobacter sp.]|nr:ParB/RepB/Spo0J family partition protein [Candidatus Saccharibacteria bacterium]